MRAWLRPFIFGLRSNEVGEFRRWLARKNLTRAKVGGIILALFAVIVLVAIEFDQYPDEPYLYAGELAVLAFSVGLIQLGIHLERSWLTKIGEYCIISASIFWMFISVKSRLIVGYGLAEFIIGTLALALMRYMHYGVSLFTFSAFGLGYAFVLQFHHFFDYEAWINALLFCCVAVIWSWGSYKSRVLEFRNKRLLEELKEKNRHLNTLAMQDGLTGLLNRRFFDQAMERWWSDKGLAEKELTLILCDIDFFKEFNDTYGHPRGDACLQNIARILCNSLRSEGDAIRLGGEEFAILLEHTSLTEGVAVAERLAELVRTGCKVTMSFGVATAKPVSSSANALYDDADAALYRAKAEGRDRVVMATSES